MPSAAFRPVNPASNALHELAVVAEDSIQMVIDMHHQQEEGEFFPALDKVLSDEERAAVLTAMSKCE